MAHTLNANTSLERISCESWIAWTGWRMVNHVTSCIHTARSWTWINALLIHASLCIRTFRIDCALGTAIWWCSNVIVQAWTCWTISANLTLGIRSAWWWQTRIDGITWFFNDNLIASGEWITGEAGNTATDWVVIDHLTIWGRWREVWIYFPFQLFFVDDMIWFQLYDSGVKEVI